MSTPPVKPKVVSLKSGPTPAQRAWVKQLATLGGAPAADQPTPGKPPAQPGAPKALTGDKHAIKKGLFDPTDIPVEIVKTVAGPHSCTVRINNNTDATLQLDPRSLVEVDDEAQIGLSHGEYNSFPPDPVTPKQSGTEFKASSKTFLGMASAGVEGRVRYILDDQNTAWTIHFDNPHFEKNTADARIDGPNRAAVARFVTPKPIAGGGDDAIYLFTLNLKGGLPPGPTPPGPGTETEVQSSCLISVNNNTQSVLTLADQGKDKEGGDFMTFPASTLQPGASTSFVFVGTPRSKDPGCRGFLVWEVGSPAAAIWRIEWDNPKGQKNTTTSSLEPQSAGLKALDQIGQGDENVPVAFTISGGGAGPGPGPVQPPVPPVPPVPETEFVPPPESRQPTLRRGDKSKDGWVEYLQFLLNAHLGTKLVQDGNFGPATHKAVITFQTREKLQVDGIVGNQTWAALRQDTPEPPSTDGRQPHTFVEEGAEARWAVESDANNRYVSSSDVFQLAVESVGDAAIDNVEATVRITPPGTKPKAIKVTIGPPFEKSPTGAGNLHAVELANFKKTFPAKDPNAKVTDYLVEAYLPQELGGDFYSAKVREE